MRLAWTSLQRNTGSLELLTGATYTRKARAIQAWESSVLYKCLTRSSSWGPSVFSVLLSSLTHSFFRVFSFLYKLSLFLFPWSNPSSWNIGVWIWGALWTQIPQLEDTCFCFSFCLMSGRSLSFPWHSGLVLWSPGFGRKTYLSHVKDRWNNYSFNEML